MTPKELENVQIACKISKKNPGAQPRNPTLGRRTLPSAFDPPSFTPSPGVTWSIWAWGGPQVCRPKCREMPIVRYHTHFPTLDCYLGVRRRYATVEK